MRPEIPLLEARNLVKRFGHGRDASSASGHAAVDNVSLVVRGGDVIGIVGASGSGKSTLARMLTRLVAPTTGTVLLRGRDIHALDEASVRREVRPAVRMVFQDPDASLNPSYTVGEGLRRALIIGGRCEPDALQDRLSALLTDVGLPVAYADKYPDELSGGEKRRLGICRALSSDPSVIVADEPLSGLDVVMQERVLALFLKVQQERKFGLLIVSHDLDRVHQACSQVAVMFAGALVELAPVSRADLAPMVRYRHPYSIELAMAKERLESSVRMDSETRDAGSGSAVAKEWELAAQQEASPPAQTGCRFRVACPRYQRLNSPSRCNDERPMLAERVPGWQVACHFPDEV